jgi:hypothetical protein
MFMNFPRPAVRRFFAAIALVLSLFTIQSRRAEATPPARAQFAELPLHFEPNRGQAPPQARFHARGSGSQLLLTDTETVWRNGPATVRMRLLGADKDAPFSGLDEQPGRSNYFRGNRPEQWQTDVPHFAKVRRENVYPGVSVVFYGAERQLEYDFIVAPGADPAQIKLAFTGAESARLNADGDLLLSTPAGELKQHKPIAYQEIDGARREVAAGYQLSTVPSSLVAFALGDYDPTRPLVIDPVLTYSSFLGGNATDYGNSIAVDASGNMYVTGETNSANFPHVGGVQGEIGAISDVFVTKLNAAGNAIIYSTFIGGEMAERGDSIAVDAAGNAYLAGRTSSEDFPATVGSFQRTYGGGDFEGFALKLNAAGNALSYCTFLGGSDNDAAIGLAVDSSGAAYVTGGSKSFDFPVTNSFQFNNSGDTDAFLTKLNPSGSGAVYSTYIGGLSTDRGSGVAVDAAGNAYVAGLTRSVDFPTVNAGQSVNGGNYDAFALKFNPTGTQLLYSTFLGGPADDRAFGLALDADGTTYVTGQAGSGFPTANALFPTFGGQPTDAFVAKFNAAGARQFATYLGGNGDDKPTAVALRNGNLYLVGYTASANFPTANPLQAANAGQYDAFVTKMNANGTALGYSTYLGGSGNDNFNNQGITFTGNLAVDANGTIYLAGHTASANFPTVNPLRATYAGGLADAYVAKIAEDATNPIDGSQFFVRQQYLDFLNREPDAAGLAYWTGQLDVCGMNAACLNRRRAEVSAAFFVENEFQNTGFFVYLTRRAALTQPTFAQYLADRNALGAGTEADKMAFLTAFVQRPEFLAQYPLTQGGPGFVNALLTNVQQNTGLNLFDRAGILEGEYLLFGRAGVVRGVIDDFRLRAAEYNRAFVLAQYFGYLRRDPDQGGYNFWLGVLNANPTNATGMVCAFITSAEYQLRFGSAITRTNADCAGLGS